MFAEVNRLVTSERARGADLARAAEALLAESGPEPADPALAVHFATAQALLALYWELRRQRPGAPPSMGGGSSLNGAKTRCRPYRRQFASEPGA